jgi:hypothetical protein
VVFIGKELGRDVQTTENFESSFSKPFLWNNLTPNESMLYHSGITVASGGPVAVV